MFMVPLEILVISAVVAGAIVYGLYLMAQDNLPIAVVIWLSAILLLVNMI